MTNRVLGLIGFVAALLLFPALRRPAAAQTPRGQSPVAGDTLTVRDHFTSVLTYRTSTGAPRRVRVALRQYAINGQKSLARFPEPGLLVVQLSGGDLATVIGRDRKERRTDELWTVPSGTSMRVEVGKEQATLEVLSVSEP
jgi:hypothetical protein